MCIFKRIHCDINPPLQTVRRMLGVGYRHVGFETKSSCRFTYEDQCATAVNTFSHLKDTSDVNKYSGADSREHSTAQD